MLSVRRRRSIPGNLRRRRGQAGVSQMQSDASALLLHHAGARKTPLTGGRSPAPRWQKRAIRRMRECRGGGSQRRRAGRAAGRRSCGAGRQSMRRTPSRATSAARALARSRPRTRSAPGQPRCRRCLQERAGGRRGGHRRAGLCIQRSGHGTLTEAKHRPEDGDMCTEPYRRDPAVHSVAEGPAIVRRGELLGQGGLPPGQALLNDLQVLGLLPPRLGVHCPKGPKRHVHLRSGVRRTQSESTQQAQGLPEVKGVQSSPERK